ncbi:DUF951 domain-containing protein [Lentilactobacillus raoultii]|uniref:DUF951 domain-containing protein n=1 Tax=Lentilactobacillus raoultii TaxID=1987503 RepID=A0ABW3PIQ2_9LACO|nr:DUF951 domain-containing protein [Lentilactobacillus raoultii]
MKNRPSYHLNDHVRLKKPHPCGGQVWQIIRLGADIRLQCDCCWHLLLLPRWKFERSFKQLVVHH